MSSDDPNPPRIFILAGPNGAGKSTLAARLVPVEMPFINADNIARELSPDDPARAALRAGKLMLRQMAERIGRHESFAIETTLAGLNYARLIPKWRLAGYHVKLFFLTVPTADYAVKRVAIRVAQGGHHIPEPVVRRRFDAGRRNFEQTYKALVDSWIVYDTGDEEPTIVGSGGRA